MTANTTSTLTSTPSANRGDHGGGGGGGGLDLVAALWRRRPGRGGRQLVFVGAGPRRRRRQRRRRSGRGRCALDLRRTCHLHCRHRRQRARAGGDIVDRVLTFVTSSCRHVASRQQSRSDRDVIVLISRRHCDAHTPVVTSSPEK